MTPPNPVPPAPPAATMAPQPVMVEQKSAVQQPAVISSGHQPQLYPPGQMGSVAMPISAAYSTADTRPIPAVGYYGQHPPPPAGYPVQGSFAFSPLCGLCFNKCD